MSVAFNYFFGDLCWPFCTFGPNGLVFGAHWHGLALGAIDPVTSLLVYNL